jgi:hypothetical protein
MKRMIFNAALAVAITLGAGFAAPERASAQSIQLDLGRDGPRLRVQENCDPRRERCPEGGRCFRRDDRRDGRHGDRRYERRSERSVCTEGRALAKAERMGLRRVSIRSAGSREIRINGRTRDGQRVRVTIGRHPSCPILN